MLCWFLPYSSVNIINVNIYTTMCKIDSGKLLYNMGSPAQGSVVTQKCWMVKGGRLTRERIYIYTYIYIHMYIYLMCDWILFMCYWVTREEQGRRGELWVFNPGERQK